MPTPLGNLRDITLRALDVLSASDVIYCEDTRVTAKLCSAYGIKTRLERSDEHTQDKRIAEIITAVKDGRIVSLVSDAGTPGISDPGSKVIAACHAARIHVTVLPGASAVVTAYAGSGLIAPGFTFLGFLPPKAGARRTHLQEWRAHPCVLMFYEAPQRVAGLLEDVRDVMGNRHVVVARELSKRYETYYTGDVETVLQAIDHKNFKGEVVVMIAPSDEEMVDDEAKLDVLLQEELRKLSLKEAVAVVTSKTGLPRKTVYARALLLGKSHDD